MIQNVCRVTLISSDEKKTQGIVWIQEWNQKERLRRALKALGISWGLAIVSVLIPLAHFILVPAFLLAGPFVAFRIYQVVSTIAGGTGNCPNCEKEFTIVKASLKWPIHDLCSACQSSVVIVQN